MGRLLAMRPRRAALYALEETIASLHEELQFTLNYAHAMVRDRNYRAAAEVIEEQRRSLARAGKRMERAMAPEAPVRSRPRVRAALVGVAAALALASGAFAAFGPPSYRPTAPTARGIEAVQRASDRLNAAWTLSDPVKLQQIVGDAKETILDAVASLTPSDRAVRLTLLESVRSLQKVLENPNVPASVREQAKKAAEQVQEIVDVATEETTETESRTKTDTESKTKAETESKSQTNTESTTQTTAPAPEATV